MRSVLAKKLSRPSGPRAARGPRRIVGRGHDARCIGCRGQLAGEPDAVAVRQVDVEQHGLGGELGHGGARLRQGARLTDDVVAALGQHRTDKFAEGGVVVDEEDRHGHGPSLRSATGRGNGANSRLAERDVSADGGATAPWALDRERASQRGDAVAQARESAPQRQRSATDTVVLDREPQPPVDPLRGDMRLVRAGVLRYVRERLRSDEVRRRLHRGREPIVRDVDGDRQRRALGQRLHGGSKAVVCQDRRVDAAGELAQLVDGGTRVLDALVEQRLEIRRDIRAALGELQGHHRMDQALLRAVMEVTHHAPALLIARLHDAGAGREQLVAGRRVRDRRGDQLREARQPDLRARRQRLRLIGPGDERSHTRPSTTTGAPTSERMPSSRSSAASSPEAFS